MSTALTTQEGVELVEPLTKKEREQLAECEGALKRHFKYLVVVGKALLEVRDARLYREDFATFEEYCQQRWQVERRQAYRLIDFAGVSDAVSNWSQEIEPPARESVARELKKLPPEDQGEAWAEVVEKTGKDQPTAKEVREHVEAKLAPPTGERVGGDWIEEVARTGEAPEGLGAEQAEAVDQEEEEEKLDGDSYSTPERYVEIGRRAMGGVINLDPMSHHAANELVGADVYYTKEDDGLAQDWRGNVWMNPPYSSALIKAAVDKLLEHWKAGEINRAVVLTNTDSSVSWWRKLAAAAHTLAFPPERIQFWHPDAAPDDPRCQRNRNSQTFFFFAPMPGELAIELEQEGWLLFERADLVALFPGTTPAQVLEHQLATEKLERQAERNDLNARIDELEREVLEQRGDLTISTSKAYARLAAARSENAKLLKTPTAELVEQVVALKRAAQNREAEMTSLRNQVEFACETPAEDCTCPGCSYARDYHLANGGKP